VARRHTGLIPAAFLRDYGRVEPTATTMTDLPQPKSPPSFPAHSPLWRDGNFSLIFAPRGRFIRRRSILVKMMSVAALAGSALVSHAGAGYSQTSIKQPVWHQAKETAFQPSTPSQRIYCDSVAPDQCFWLLARRYSGAADVNRPVSTHDPRRRAAARRGTKAQKNARP
jgi:hypothetical protein